MALVQNFTHASVHMKNIEKEILDFLKHATSKPENVKKYAKTQAEKIVTKMYAEDEESPDLTDPENIEADYYRESISEYSDVFEEYEIE